ncbi:zinc finger protein, putative [Plasmodium gaboni]|uniref:Zinc finger protein, putative n=1 Tax=Plasmodium gaboni TaxID=647221 RepID=A0ABY1UUP9_9APIC|nr:zinc finger protein, putative [Plasmodium gaboni]
MEKINDKKILEKISDITGNTTKNALVGFKKKKKKKKKKNVDISPDITKKIKNKKINKTENTFDNFKYEPKKETCKFFFKKGKCIHNDKCTYSHDVIPIYKISKLCKFLVKGTCHKQNCIFSHDYELFYCRNNVIYNSCHNPACKFKHVKIDNSINNADEYNKEVDNVLTKDDKIRFLYNNKNYLMELLIHKYHTFDNTDHKINIDNLIKKNNYPWFINGIIDIIKLDFKYNKADSFFKLINIAKNNQNNNLKSYMDNPNNQNVHNNNDLTNNASTNNQDIKSSQQTIKDEDLKNNNDTQNGDNKLDNNVEENFDDYNFYSSEEEDYTQYLNKYFDMDT